VTLRKSVQARPVLQMSEQKYRNLYEEHLQELQRSRQFLETIIENASVWLNVLDNENNVVVWNRAAEVISGYSREEVIGHNKIWSWLYPDDKYRKQITDSVAEVLQHSRIEQDVETNIRCKDGQNRIISWNERNLLNEHGKVVGSVAIGRDITKRKRVEEALANERKVLRQLIDNLPDNIFIKDVESRFVMSNLAHAHLLRANSPEEIVGKTDYDIFPRELAASYYEDEQAVMRSGQSLVNREERTIDPEGKTRWLLTTKVPLRDDHGNVIGIAGINRDITERKRMQEELERYSKHLEELVQERTKKLSQSETRYRTLVENIPQKIFTKDRNSVYVSCNDRYAQDLNIRSDEIAGKTDYDFHPRELADNYRVADRRVIESGKTEELEEKYVVSGQEFFVDTIKTPIQDAEGNVTGLLGIFWDITQRKKMENALQQAERLAAVGETAAMVGHDLRNPLQGIAGAAYNMRRYLRNESDPMLKEMLAVIENGVEYANKIISDLLEFSREMQLQPLPTTPKAVVTQALKDAQVPDKVRVEDTTANAPQILVDEPKIRRVLTNLIKNAVDAMPEGGELSISSAGSQKELSISVKDTGVGISHGELKRIWTPLHSTKAKGIGLGLSICKRIVEAHGGSISVQSVVGKGTTFTLKLPIEYAKGGE
jgi:PAS domain S-box-containing protein